MLYLSFALNAVLVALYVWERIDSQRRLDRYRAEAASREISLLNRIQAPELAVTQTFPDDPDPEPTYLPVDDTPHADNVWDLFQQEHS